MKYLAQASAIVLAGYVLATFALTVHATVVLILTGQVPR